MIAAYAFAGNTSIIRVVFEGKVLIDDGVFADCIALQEIKILDANSRFIGRNTIDGCTGLEGITLPAGTSLVDFRRNVLYDYEVRRKLVAATA